MAFQFQKLFELGPDTTPWRKLGSEGVSTFELRGRPALMRGRRWVTGGVYLVLAAAAALAGGRPRPA